RTPRDVVVSTPEVAAAADTAPPVSVGYPQAGTQGTGASIIRVDPPAAEGGNGAIVIRDPSSLGQDLRVAHLPDRALVEETEIGPLPRRAADGRRPFDVYARPWSGARGAK